jgi:predicted RecB family nuclease
VPEFLAKAQLLDKPWSMLVSPESDVFQDTERIFGKRKQFFQAGVLIWRVDEQRFSDQRKLFQQFLAQWMLFVEGKCQICKWLDSFISQK